MDEINNTTETETQTKKNKSEKKPFVFGVKFGSAYDKLQTNIPALVITCVFTFVLMGLVACAVFFANVKGAEKVLVPNVEGKKLEDALLEMQTKELYPRISLRYSDLPGDEGLVLDQSPKAGAIVKGYSRVSLVVSRGVIVDEVGDYTGKTLEEVQLNLQTLFAGQTRPLIVLAEPEYAPDKDVAAGVIIAQDPPAGTSISEPVTVHLVVSRGLTFENTRSPAVLGQSVNDLLQTIARSKLVFDITGHIAEDGEKPGTVVKQPEYDTEFIPNYTRVEIEMALPSEPVGGNVYGIFTEKLGVFPYPVSMKLEAIPSEGSAYTILNFVHPGENITIPYSVPKGTVLVLYVADREVSRKTVQ